MCKYFFCCIRKKEKPIPNKEDEKDGLNNTEEILIEQEQNIKLINKQNEEIFNLKSIIQDMHTKVRDLEQELENNSKINNFENTDAQLFLSQTVYITHLKKTLQELELKESNAIPKSDFDQLAKELFDMRNNYNTLIQYYNFYKGYYDETISKAQIENPQEDPPST